VKVVVTERADVPERCLRLYALGAVSLALALRLAIPAPIDAGIVGLLILAASAAGPWIACWYLGPKRKNDRLAFLFGLSVANGISLAVFADFGLRSSSSIFWGVLVFAGIGWGVTMGLGALSMLLGSRLLDRYRVFARAGLCARCGYDLRGSQSGRCPECGTRIDTPSTAADDEQRADEE
jgi:hypothetical protein